MIVANESSQRKMKCLLTYNLCAYSLCTTKRVAVKGDICALPMFSIQDNSTKMISTATKTYKEFYDTEL